MNAHALITRIQQSDPVSRFGHVVRVLPTFIEADGPDVPMGAICQIEARHASGQVTPRPMAAEVVKIDRDYITLVPVEAGMITHAGAKVVAISQSAKVSVGDGFLGRAVDALGRAIDGGAVPYGDVQRSLHGDAISPMARAPAGVRLPTGIRAVDSLLSLGVGQRVGVFAASGVGKTSLITQIARQTKADACVICLVGERGREAESLWMQQLSPAMRSKTTLVATTSDETAAMRVRAANFALALAEQYRAQGRHVLFILDSMTRLAMALREMGLAAGEPPTVRAYTPGVFAAMPRFIERCGALKSGGAISAFLTILCETDDLEDPIAEMLKSLLDGHIMLSRTLAERGHYPAIDVPRSISRYAESVMTAADRTVAQRAVAELSLYEASKTLIEAGLYVSGSDAELDRTVRNRPQLLAFLQQSSSEHVAAETAILALQKLMMTPGGAR